MKINNLLENTLASMPEPGQVAFRSARSETSLEETTVGGTVAGVVAPVAKPMDKMIKRESGIAKGIKKKMVDEGELSENDLIMVPGQMSKRVKGFVQKDRNEMERIEMAKSDLIQSVKSAKSIFNILKTSDDEIEGWVQEKLAKAEDYLNTVREYLEGKNVAAEAMSPGVRMHRALQREKEKREASQRYAEKHYPIGKKPEPIKEPNKEVKEAGEQPDWMKDMIALAHKMAPQDEMRRKQAERAAKEQEERQKRIQQDIDNLPDLIAQYNDMEAEYESMGGKNWQYADREQNLSDEERKARGMETSMRQLANRIHTAKKASQGLAEVAPPGAKAERMVKHIKKSYAKDGKITPKEKSIAYATAWKAHNKGSVEEGVAEGSLNEYGDTAKGQKMLTKVQKRAVDRAIKADDKRDPKAAKKNADTANRAWERMTDKDLEEGWMSDDEPVSWEKGGTRAPTGAFRNPAAKKVVFSGTGDDGGKYEVIQSGPDDYMIHANGKHIDTYPSLQRAMSVLKNEVSGLKKTVDEESKGLWANIHAKRERIKHGSGEHMRKPGSKGAPTADALRKSAK